MKIVMNEMGLSRTACIRVQIVVESFAGRGRLQLASSVEKVMEQAPVISLGHDKTGYEHD